MSSLLCATGDISILRRHTLSAQDRNVTPLPITDDTPPRISGGVSGVTRLLARSTTGGGKSGISKSLTPHFRRKCPCHRRVPQLLKDLAPAQPQSRCITQRRATKTPVVATL